MSFFDSYVWKQHCALYLLLLLSFFQKSRNNYCVPIRCSMCTYFSSLWINRFVSDRRYSKLFRINSLLFNYVLKLSCQGGRTLEVWVCTLNFSIFFLKYLKPPESWVLFFLLDSSVPIKTYLCFTNKLNDFNFLFSLTFAYFIYWWLTHLWKKENQFDKLVCLKIFSRKLQQRR